MPRKHPCTHPLYGTWRSMRNRCESPVNQCFPHYGGRGIKVCAQWQDFDSFVADVGERPPGCTLDRIDNNRGYEPSNVRWATRSEQLRNQRRNHRLTHGGVTLCLTEWAERTGLTKYCISARIKSGWTVEHALTTPVRRFSRYGL